VGVTYTVDKDAAKFIFSGYVNTPRQIALRNKGRALVAQLGPTATQAQRNDISKVVAAFNVGGCYEREFRTTAAYYMRRTFKEATCDTQPTPSTAA
jgi:hypothetical protein